MPKYKNYKSKKHFSKKFLWIAVVILVGVGASVAWMAVANKGPFTDKSTDDTGINYNPPTEQEIQETEDHKREIAEEAEKDQQNDKKEQEESGSKKKTEPFITVAQQFNDEQYGNRVTVRAYMPDIVESGGTCSVLFTKGGQEVTWKVDALPDVSTTICDVIMVPRDKFPTTGTWTVTVTYTSANTEGTSQPTQVEVK